MKFITDLRLKSARFHSEEPDPVYVHRYEQKTSLLSALLLSGVNWTENAEGIV